MNGHTISTNIVCVNGKCKKTTNIYKNKKCDKVYDRLINRLHQRKPTRLPDLDELTDDKDPLKLDIPFISMPLLTKSHHHTRKRSRAAALDLAAGRLLRAGCEGSRRHTAHRRAAPEPSDGSDASAVAATRLCDWLSRFPLLGSRTTIFS